MKITFGSFSFEVSADVIVFSLYFGLVGALLAAIVWHSV